MLPRLPRIAPKVDARFLGLFFLPLKQGAKNEKDNGKAKNSKDIGIGRAL